MQSSLWVMQFESKQAKAERADYETHRRPTPYSNKCGDTKESAPRRLAAVGYGSGSVRALFGGQVVSKFASNSREGLPVAVDGRDFI